MCSVLRNEFQLRNIGLNYDHPEQFTQSQWKWPRPLFVVFRFVLAAYTIFGLVHILVVMSGSFSATSDPNFRYNTSQLALFIHHNPLVFLTNWTYIVLTCHFFVAFLIVAFECIQTRSSTHEGITLNGIVSENSTISSRRHPTQNVVDVNLKTNVIDVLDEESKTNRHANADEPDCETRSGLCPTPESGSRLPWYSRLSWLLSNVASVWAIIVTSIFYGILFKPRYGLSFADINVHTLNTVFIVIDNVVCARPIRILHVIYPMIFGAAYVIFSVLYWSADHLKNVIYHGVLDWNYPLFTGGIMVGIFFVIVVLQLVYYGISMLKLHIYNKLHK